MWGVVFVVLVFVGDFEVCVGVGVAFGNYGVALCVCLYVRFC